MADDEYVIHVRRVIRTEIDLDTPEYIYRTVYYTPSFEFVRVLPYDRTLYILSIC